MSWRCQVRGYNRNSQPSYYPRSIGRTCYMSRIYVETTIPSFYFERRSQPEMAARRQWTRQWWDNSGANEERVTSAAVLDELQQGSFPSQPDALRLIGGLPLLAVDDTVLRIVEGYIARRLMPSDPTGDALHLALASYHRCDFLVTWNCQHLANANKFAHIRRINAIMKLHLPALVTPLELLAGEPSS